MFSRIGWGLLFGLWAAACAPAASAPETAPPPWQQWTPQPYATRTPAAAPRPPAAIEAAAAPTPTPHLYQVQEGDTLVGIASRFGLSLDALLLANPTVSAAALQPGDVLQLPAAEDALLLPQADGVEVTQAVCYPQTPTTSTCLFLVANRGEQPVEDVMVQLALTLPNGERTTVQAFLLLDALFPGQQAPGAVHLDGRWETAAIRARVQTALPFAYSGGRYAAARVQQLQAEGQGAFLQVDGLASPPFAEGQWQTVQVALSVFDASGRLVGVRRVDLPVEQGEGGAQPFSVQVFSFGGERVQVSAAAVWAAGPCPFCP